MISFPPVATSITTAIGARNGILVRSRLALEEARTVNTVIFDKTGTLTRGEFGVATVLRGQGLGRFLKVPVIHIRLSQAEPCDFVVGVHREDFLECCEQRLVLDRGHKSMAFVMLEMRIARAKAFFYALISDHPEYSAIAVEFIAAEDVLRERYKEHPWAAQTLEGIIERFHSSLAFAATKEDENGGIKALLKGQYKGRGNY